jgi:chromate transporter
VHIALMEEELVKRRNWLSREEFLDLLGAANLIPGPNSTELAIHLGYKRAGWPGLLLAGACFILPAALITGLFAWVYVRFGTIPEVGFLLYGIKPAILAVVLGALFRLAKTTYKNAFPIVISVLAVAASLAGGDELFVLFGGGFLGIARVLATTKKETPKAAAFVLLGLPASTLPTTLAEASLTKLGLFFLKIGSVLYGSGYVLISFLRGGLVTERHWLTEQQLLDAVAIGQFTPGPVFTTATFIGYLIQGVPGAIVATLGIFLPSFVFVALTNPWIPKMRSSKVLSGFLDGVNPAALGLMAAVVIQLGADALVGWPAWVIGALAAPLALFTKLNPTWLIVGGAILGFVSSLL